MKEKVYLAGFIIMTTGFVFLLIGTIFQRVQSVQKKEPDMINKPEPETKEKELTYDDFDIIYFPITKRFYPRFKGMYLYKNPNTGYFETQKYVEFAVNHSVESACKKEIDLFLEYKGYKTTVIKIK